LLRQNRRSASDQRDTECGADVELSQEKTVLSLLRVVLLAPRLPAQELRTQAAARMRVAFFMAMASLAQHENSVETVSVPFRPARLLCAGGV